MNIVVWVLCRSYSYHICSCPSLHVYNNCTKHCLLYREQFNL